MVSSKLSVKTPVEWLYEFELAVICGGMPSVAVYRTVSVVSAFVVSVLPLEVTVTSTQYVPGVWSAGMRINVPPASEIAVSVMVNPLKSLKVMSAVVPFEENTTEVAPVNPCPEIWVMETAFRLLPVEGVMLVTIGPVVTVAASLVAAVSVENVKLSVWLVPSDPPATTVAVKRITALLLVEKFQVTVWPLALPEAAGAENVVALKLKSEGKVTLKAPADVLLPNIWNSSVSLGSARTDVAKLPPVFLTRNCGAACASAATTNDTANTPARMRVFEMERIER